MSFRPIHAAPRSTKATDAVLIPRARRTKSIETLRRRLRSPKLCRYIEEMAFYLNGYYAHDDELPHPDDFLGTLKPKKELHNPDLYLRKQLCESYTTQPDVVDVDKQYRCNLILYTYYLETTDQFKRAVAIVYAMMEFLGYTPSRVPSSVVTSAPVPSLDELSWALAELAIS